MELEWDTALIFDDERHNYGERRKTALGFLDGRLAVLAFTERNNNLRIISMRKANNREEKFMPSSNEQRKPLIGVDGEVRVSVVRVFGTKVGLN